MMQQLVLDVTAVLQHNEPLGATVRNEGEKVVIGRVVRGGAAERSGNLQPGGQNLTYYYIIVHTLDFETIRILQNKRSEEDYASSASRLLLKSLFAILNFPIISVHC